MESDGDSAIGYSRTSTSSSTSSLPSYIRELDYMHGRGYHTYHAGKYPFPSDEREIERMDLEHAIQILALDGRLHLSPLNEPRHILDLGTGTGSWAIEMADLYTGATVTGIDLSPIQPEWVPPNCVFLVDDVESTRRLESGEYDFIHARFLTGGIGDFSELYAKAYNALRPGGWIEVTESAWELVPEPPGQRTASWLGRWSVCIEQGLRNMGKHCPNHTELPRLLRNAGFSRVCSVTNTRPIGRSHGKESVFDDGPDIGEAGRLNLLRGLEAWSLQPLIVGSGWSEQSVRDLVNLVRIELCQANSTQWQMV